MPLQWLQQLTRSLPTSGFAFSSASAYMNTPKPYSMNSLNSGSCNPKMFIDEGLFQNELHKWHAMQEFGASVYFACWYLPKQSSGSSDFPVELSRKKGD